MNDSRKSDLFVDLENGDNTSSDEDEIKEHALDEEMDRDEVAGQDGSTWRGEGLNIPSKSSFISGGVKVIDQAGRGSKEKKMSGEKKQKRGSKKPTKPPRPPGAPSLVDEADIKLVREICELSRLRRARYERIKALRNMRADKASLSKSNVFAMIVTILFICVIVFQGIDFLIFRHLGFSCMMLIGQSSPYCIPKVRANLINVPVIIHFVLTQSKSYRYNLEVRTGIAPTTNIKSFDPHKLWRLDDLS
ncbi:hypothetical protein SCA6_003349 [Theobroma cacao]